MMSQDLTRPSAEIRIHQDSEETKWSTTSQEELLGEELEDMDAKEQDMYDSYDRIERAALSEDFAKIKLTQYLQTIESKEDKMINFPTRVDIEHDAMEAWKALNPRSGKFEKQDQEVIAKVVDWLDGISLYEIETMTPGIYMGPVIATYEQELRQKILPWIARRHLLGNDPDLARLTEFGEGTLRRKRLYDIYGRIKLSVIKRAKITNEMEELRYKISRVIAKNSLMSYASPLRSYIIQMQNRLHYLSNARVSSSYL